MKTATSSTTLHLQTRSIGGIVLSLALAACSDSTPNQTDDGADASAATVDPETDAGTLTRTVSPLEDDDADTGWSYCEQQSDCSSDETCMYLGESGLCAKASSRACNEVDPAHGAPVCVDDRGYNAHPARDGDSGDCETSADCSTVEGHLNGACIDTGEAARCVPLCEFEEDFESLACVYLTDTIRSDCERDHERLATVFAVVARCLDLELTAWTCAEPTADLSDDVRSTVQCILEDVDEGGISCRTLVLGDHHCFSGDAPFELLEFLEDELVPRLHTATRPLESDDDGDVCSTDCDCARCYYCSDTGGSAHCVYGGEGEFGCFRGCPF